MAPHAERLHRRAEVSQAVNDHYATALDDSATIKELTEPLCQPVVRPGREKKDGTRTQSRQFREFNPLSAEDLKLLDSVARLEFTVLGLRNKDVREALFGPDTTGTKEHRRCSGAVSRRLSLLRAHGLLEKVSKSHTYRVPNRSRLALSALLAASNSTLKHLNQLAACKCEQDNKKIRHSSANEDAAALPEADRVFLTTEIDGTARLNRRKQDSERNELARLEGGRYSLRRAVFPFTWKIRVAGVCHD